MRIHLHFLIVATCFPAIVYSQSGSRSDVIALTDEPTRYLDPRRRIDPVDIDTGSSERSLPYERRSSRYFEDRYGLARPPYRSSLRRRRPSPRIPPLGRRYGRRLRRPSPSTRPERIRTTSERRRPFYDPYFREYEPPRRGRPRRRFPSRPRRIRPRGPQRRGPREYYRGDEYRPRDEIAVERSPSLSDRRLDDFDRRVIFDRTRRTRMRERLPVRRGSTFRERRVDATLPEERLYLDEGLASVPRRRTRPDVREEFARAILIDDRLPSDVLSDRSRDTGYERVLPPYDAVEESQTSYISPRRRQNNMSTSDFFDIHNSFDIFSPLDTENSVTTFKRRMPLREERLSSSISDSVSINEIIQTPSSENSNIQITGRPSASSLQTRTQLTEIKSQADGFINKLSTDSGSSTTAHSKPDGFLTKKSSGHPRSVKSSSILETNEPSVLSETVQRSVLSEEIIDRETLHRQDKISESKEKSLEAISVSDIPPTTTKMVLSAVSTAKPSIEAQKEIADEQNVSVRVVGLSNVLSKKHPKFFNIPIPIPKSSLVVNLAKEIESDTTQIPIGSTGKHVDALNISNTDQAIKPKYTVHSSNSIVPIKNLSETRPLDNSHTISSVDSPPLNSTSEGNQLPQGASNSLRGLRQTETSNAMSSAMPESFIPERRNRVEHRASEDSIRETDTRARPLMSRTDREEVFIPRGDRRRPSPTRTLYRDDLLLPERSTVDRTLVYDAEAGGNPSRRRLRDYIAIDERDPTFADKSTRDDRPTPMSRRTSSRRYYRDKLSSTDLDNLDRRRILSDDISPIARLDSERGRYIDDQSISDDDIILSERRRMRERPLTRRRRPPIRHLSADVRRRSDRETISSEVTRRDELPLPQSDRGLRDEMPITRRRRLPSRSIDEGLPSERRAEVDIPARRRNAGSEATILPFRRGRGRRLRVETPIDVPFREEDEPLRRRRLPSHEEGVRAISREEIPPRRRGSPPPEAIPTPLPREDRPIGRRRLMSPEERTGSRDEPPVRRRRPLTSEERPGAVSREDRLVRPRRLFSPAERLRDVPGDDLPVRRRRLLPTEERLRTVIRGDASVRRRRPPSFLSSEERSSDRPRSRRLSLRDRPRRRELISPPRRRDIAFERTLLDGRRPRIEESFPTEPDIIRRRLRAPERRYRVRRTRTDDEPVTSIRSLESRLEVPSRREYETSSRELHTISTVTPIETTTEERLRLGAVRARGGENGFPVHGGFCPGESCSDGGLAAGVQNGTGTGTLELFLERQRTGENEDIAAYERDLRPRRTSLVV